MKVVSHEDQQKAWEEEHSKPTVLKQMDSTDASSGVEKFLAYLKDNGLPAGSGIEMGCGKGRNVIWLAQQGIAMSGIDFSSEAIEEAKRRAEGAGIKADFRMHDATKRWPYADHAFDLGIDCFASTDIESESGRIAAIAEMRRVIKPGGHVLAYLLSPEDEFHKEMIIASPSPERNAFVHSTGKFEKVYDEEDIAKTFRGMQKIAHERVVKNTLFDGKEYACRHHWIIFRV